MVAKSISHHFETVRNHGSPVFPRESALQGFLGGAGFRPSTVCPVPAPSDYRIHFSWVTTAYLAVVPQKEREGSSYPRLLLFLELKSELISLPLAKPRHVGDTQ